MIQNVLHKEAKVVCLQYLNSAQNQRHWTVHKTCICKCDDECNWWRRQFFYDTWCSQMWQPSTWMVMWRGTTVTPGDRNSHM